MKRLDLYLAREMAVPFLIGTVAVVLMFQANMLIALFKQLNLTQVPAEAIAQVILFKTPGFLNMTLPVGMALSSSLAISRLARESELTALRSSGVSILRVVSPVLVIGVLVAVGNWLVAERVMPTSERMARERTNEVVTLGLAPTMQSNVILKLQQYTATFGTVARTEDDGIRLTDILLIERRPTGETVLITSDSGEYRQGVWSVNKPLVRVMRESDLLTVETPGVLTIDEPIEVQEIFLTREPQEQSLDELRAAIEEGKKQLRSTRMLEVQYHTRFSVPAACLVFALTGPVFAVWLSRSGPFVGVLVSIVMVLIYYNAYVISTEIIGRNGWAPPVVAAWLPNGILFLLGLFALRRAE